MNLDKEEMKEIKHQLISLTGGFCNAHVNDEYTQLCERLIDKMARKRSVPFISGKVETWAAGIIHALGTINFLFDKTQKLHVSHDQISEYFVVPKSTMGQKSKIIRDMFRMNHWDPEFSTAKMQRDNPFRRMTMVNGYIVSLDR